MSDSLVHVRLQQVQDYQFRHHYEGLDATVLGDEPLPLGQAQGPSPVQLLASAVGNCLADSLLFALRKFKQAPDPLQCDVLAEVGRNAEGRMRVLGLQATLTLGVPAAQLAHLPRVLEQFESFCTVTQSVGQGIAVQVVVRDSTGAVLKG